MYKKIAIISLICLFIDQITKYIVTTTIQLFDSIDVIKPLFKVTHVRNHGAAWSIFEGNKIFLILVAFSSLFFIYWFFIKNNKLKTFEIIIYGVLIGGILGNLIDRIILGYVIDFLDFNILGYDFPIFNAADIFIVVSIGLMVIGLFKEEEKDDKISS
ncbi:MAG: signal peptidase II [Bacilli bacterium]|nr:signal peptidase II [Bacilli bacterium]MDD4282634.1 signal peptidase II [Bacilli bacterium]MDD4719071.1 signal peptidase II [Bacilli bacterium]